jgi:malate dehydrogenase
VSARALYGFRSDLTDAYAETAPQMDIALTPEDVVGDVVVMSAGAQAPTPVVTRDDMARCNLPLFRSYARALARYGHGQEVVLIVTNPVELGVTVFAQEIGAGRVVGIGAYSDSLRFRREVATDLGAPRQLVSGFAAGEHGANLIPLWSSVRVYGFDAEETADAVARMRGDAPLAEFTARVRTAHESIAPLLLTDTRQAFERVNRMPPDIRVLVRPYLTHLSGSKTVMATANVTVDMVRQIMEGREMSVAGQVMLEGDGFYGIKGAFGVPLIVSNQGVVRVQTPSIWSEEVVALHQAAVEIGRKIARWTEAD